jgi:hypothetical protein
MQKMDGAIIGVLGAMGESTLGGFTPTMKNSLNLAD